MLLSVLYGLIGIAILTAFCIIGAFIAPPMAYWFMTPKAKRIMEESGISKKIHEEASSFFDGFDRHCLCFILVADRLRGKTRCH